MKKLRIIPALLALVALTLMLAPTAAISADASNTIDLETIAQSVKASVSSNLTLTAADSNVMALTTNEEMASANDADVLSSVAHLTLMAATGSHTATTLGTDTVEILAMTGDDENIAGFLAMIGKNGGNDTIGCASCHTSTSVAGVQM